MNKVDGLELEDESEDGEQHDKTSGPRPKPIPLLCRVDPSPRDHVSSGGTGNCNVTFPLGSLQATFFKLCTKAEVMKNEVTPTLSLKAGIITILCT